jgi:rfaE bifunctional protein kinase chain/domain
MAGRQQLARLDREQTHDLTVLERALFLNTTAKILQEAKVTGLVFQDYNKGVLTKEVIETVSSAAHSLGIPIFVDPKLHNFWSYQGAALFKPNLKEVREAIGTPVEPSLFSLREAAKLIRSKTSAKNILITLSEHGLFFDNGDFSEIVSTRARVVADPCGAGDTVISMAALAICQGFSPMDVAQLANLAGGQVVEKSGVVAINKQQLLDEFFHYKNQV